MGRRKELKKFVSLLKQAGADLRAVEKAAKKYRVKLDADIKRVMRKGADRDQAAKAAKSKSGEV